MEKDKTVERNSTIISTVLTSEDTKEVLELSEKLGISTSHLGRALIRLALQYVNGVHAEAQHEMMLRLIKLGK